MPAKCKTAKNNIEAINANDKAKRDDFKRFTPFSDMNKTIEEELKNLYPDGEFLNETKIDQHIIDTWGDKAEIMGYVTKIYGLLSSTTITQDMFWEFVVKNQPEGIKVTLEKGKLDLRLFPVDSLKIYYAYLINRNKTANPKGIAYANFGGRLSAFKTPGALQEMEPTGAWWLISKATQSFPQNVSSHINTFMSSVREMKNQAKKYKLPAPRRSVTQIYDEVGDLITHKDPDLNVQVLNKYMLGWIFLDENDNFMIYKDIDILTDKKGYPKKFPDGEVMYGFQNPVPLKDYSPEWSYSFKKGKKFKKEGVDKGAWFIDLKGTQLKKFKELAEDFRKVDDLVFAYSTNMMDKSLNEKLLPSLVKQFKPLTVSQVKQIFFSPFSKRAKAIIKGLSEDKLKLYTTYRDVFETKISDDIIMTNGGRLDQVGGLPDYKKNHFPVQYHKPVHLMMVDKLVNEFTIKIKEADEIINDLSESNEIRKEALKLKNIYNGKLNSAKTIQDGYDGYTQDVFNNQLMSFAKDAKHFKRITNQYDIRAARFDRNVYYDYLRATFSPVERNSLSATLVDAIGVSESDVVNRAAINMYKIPFADPTTEGLFGLSTEDITNFYGGDAVKVERYLRALNTFLTGTYLGGFTTPYTNLSAIQENIYDYGWEPMRKGMAQLATDSKRPKIDAMMQQSGVLEYSDFFSRSMVNGIVDVQLEQDIHEHIIGAMFQYHERIHKGMTESKSRKIFEEYAGPILGQSTAWMDVAELYIPKEERLKMRAKELRLQKIQIGLNKFAEFAITRSYEFKHVLKDVDSSKIWKISGAAERTVLSIGQGINFALNALKSNMSDTEAYVRSLTFVIAANKAWDSGHLNQEQNWWDYTDPQDIAELISIGSLLSEHTNFGLSTQSIGRVGWGAFGKLFSKFKIWPMQKWAKDKSRFYWAYVMMKDQKEIENQSWSPKAMTKVFKKLFTNPWGKKAIDMRSTQSSMAILRSFGLVQGTTTILFDVFFGGLAFKLPLIGNMIYRSAMGRQVRNLTSDLISFLALPFITLPLRIGLSGLFGAMDEEEAERTIRYYFRRTMLGYLPMTVADFTFAAFNAARDEWDAAYRDLPFLITPLPLGLHRTVKDIVKFIVASEKKGLK